MKLRGTLGLLGAVALSGVASAVPMTWDYSGTCTEGDCGAVPSITGTLNGDPALTSPSNELSALSFLVDEIASYSFTVGGYTFTGGGLQAVGSYQLDSDGNIVGGSMTFANVFALQAVSVNAFSWSFLDANLFSRDVEARGTGSYALATAVPEPGVLGMLGAGLVAMGFLCRRRSR